MWPMSFKDHFSNHADLYAKYRPTYPSTLYQQLAQLTEGHALAWDCGTGNGQAAVALANHYAQVHATDASQQQIEKATPHPKVAYAVAPAEQCPLPNHSVDLVSVAQAIHWFNFEGFYAEVRRVCKPGALVAAWTYTVFQVTDAVDAVVKHFYENITGPYWPPERRYIDAAYATIPFPFEVVPFPALTLETHWTLHDVVNYLSTWSAVQRYKNAKGSNPLPLIEHELTQAWGNPSQRRLVQWPLHMLCGRVT